MGGAMSTDSLRRAKHDKSVDLSQVYSIKCDTETIRIRSPDNAIVSVPADCKSALSTLSVFAPSGVRTIEKQANLSIVDGATGRSIDFPAEHLCDIANLISTFAIVGDAGAEMVQDNAPPSSPDTLFNAPSPDLSEVPSWIAQNNDFKQTLVEDDGRIVLEFTPLRMSKKYKYVVEGRCQDGTPDYWGYQVIADGRPFGWVVLMGIKKIIVAGIYDDPTESSKHMTVKSAMIRISTHLDDTAVQIASE